jgi:hypothetical protein
MHGGAYGQNKMEPKQVWRTDQSIASCYRYTPKGVAPAVRLLLPDLPETRFV